jgi:hypothetical protein
MIVVEKDAHSVVIYHDHEKYDSMPRPPTLETTQRHEIDVRYHEP